jgi:hypothetical protein
VDVSDRHEAVAGDLGLRIEPVDSRRNDLLSGPSRTAITTPSREVSDRLSRAAPSARPLVRETEMTALSRAAAF